MVENNFKQVNEDAEVAQRQYVTYDDWQSFQGYVHESNKSASAAIFSVFLCLIISIWILMIPFNGNPPDWAVIVSAFVIFIVLFIVVGVMEKDNHDVATNTWVKRKDLKAQGWTDVLFNILEDIWEARATVSSTGRGRGQFNEALVY